MDVSPLDIRVLRFVLENGVLESERDIAKKLRISPSTFSFKMRKFEDKGIITTYKYRVDFSKIGLRVLAWIFCKINYGNMQIKDVMQKLLSYPQVHVCLLISGENNICLKVYGEDKIEINEFVKKIVKDFDKVLEHSNTLFVSKQIKSHNRIVEDQKEEYNVNEADLKILSEKMLNPKLTINEVAKKLKMHRNSVRMHWAKLLENKIIIKKTPIINPDLHREIGIYFMSVNLFRTEKGKINKLASELAEINEVHELNLLEPNSGYDSLAIIRTNGLDSYYKITSNFYSDKKFSNIIQNSSSSIIISSDSRKHTYIKDIGVKKFVKEN